MRRLAALLPLLPLVLAKPHCKVARIVSEGWHNLSHIGKAEFFIDDRKLDFEAGRGLNIIVLDPGTQEVLSQNCYDTWMHQAPENARLTQDLAAIPEGSIVMLALKDDGMELLDHAAKDQLRSIGATKLHHNFRQGYALISSKGGKAIAEGLGKVEERIVLEGELPCKECIRAAVVSNSAAGGEAAKFYLNGEAWDAPAGDGLNVLVVDRVTQKPVDFKRYVLDSKQNAQLGTGASFAADVHLLPEGTIILVAAWPASHEIIDDAGRMALQWLGASAAKESFDGGSYAFIGSKDGWAISEVSNKTGRAVAEGRLPCVLKDTTPRELPFPQAAFPGETRTQTNAAWPSGQQPKPFAAWPRTSSGRLESCWKSRVVRNKFSDACGNTLWNCHNLTATLDSTEEACRASCAHNPECGSWRFSPADGGCLQGSAMDCAHYGEELEGFPEADEEVQHGEVLVLKPLLAVQVLGLRHLGRPAKRDFEGVIRCRDWCYANLNCQFWQYGEDGCYVEDPEHGAVVQYPLTLHGGAKVYSDTARTMMAGEYIQHFCPPKPLGFKNKSKELGFTPGAAIWWNGSLVLGKRGMGNWTPWDTAPDWPEDDNGLLLPCRKTTVLEDHTLPSREWQNSCLSRVNPIDLEEESCRNICNFDSNCSFWGVSGTVGREACYQSTGWDCESERGIREWIPKEDWMGQRIQHGEVKVMKDISKLEIYNLYHLGKCHEGDDETCTRRCRDWCYSDVRCRYWQYGKDGCWVDPVGDGAPAYAFGLKGAISLSKAGHAKLAGEYVWHYCRDEDIMHCSSPADCSRSVNTHHPGFFESIWNAIKNFLWWIISGIWWLISSFFKFLWWLLSSLWNWLAGLPWWAKLLLLLLLLLALLACLWPYLQRLFPQGGARNLRTKVDPDPYAYSLCPCIHECGTGEGAWNPIDPRRICVVLEKAPLEFACVRQDGSKQEHAPEDLLTTFHCLQALQDSALAKAGKLQVFMHSPKHLVEVHPNLLPPATFSEFKRYVNTVLTEGEVHGEPRDFQPPCMLMRTLHPPVKRHLLRNSSCHAISPSGRRTTLDEVAQRDIANKKNMVFVLGMSSVSDAVREPNFGADYAPDVVNPCPFIVSKGQVCSVLCRTLLPYVGVHDPPLEQDHAGRLLNLDARYTDGPEPLSRPMNEPGVEASRDEP